MVLESDERRALIAVLRNFDQVQFKSWLMLDGGVKLSTFSAETKPIEAIIADFLDWIERDNRCLVNLLKGLIVKFGEEHSSVATLQEAVVRIQATQAQLAKLGCPSDARLAEGRPIVNRSALRQFLKAAMNHGGPAWASVSIVKVAGARGLGRSHSWYLIKHVANTGVAEALKFDLASATLANQTLDVLFDTLERNLKITDARKPTSDGVTSDTLAARFAEELAGCLARAAGNWNKPYWLVFDSLDRDLRPEVKRFVSLLCRERLEGVFGNCVIFLLGPDAVTEPDDPGRSVQLELLTPFTNTEISDAATALNSIGRKALQQSDLDLRIGDAQALAQHYSGPDLCREVFSKLVDLRIEVGA